MITLLACPELEIRRLTDPEDRDMCYVIEWLKLTPRWNPVITRYAPGEGDRAVTRASEPYVLDLP